jgi:hypothetical protein
LFVFFPANLRIRILENTDHRPFKKVDIPQQISDHQNNSNSDEIDKTIAHFKIDDYDLSIDRFYNNHFVPPLFKNDVNNDPSSYNIAANDCNGSNFGWSFGISNIQKNDEVDIILVAVSRIDLDEDMKKMNREVKKSDYTKDLEIKKYKKSNKPPGNNRQNIEHNIIIDNKKGKGTVIYRLILKKKGRRDDVNSENDIVVSYHSYQVSGICKFIENDSDALSKSGNGVDQLNTLKRFIVLNFQGIYNFGFNDNFEFLNLTERFDYPKIIRREFDNWHPNGCMKQLLSCIYRKYFLVTQYKNDVQSLEGKKKKREREIKIYSYRTSHQKKIFIIQYFFHL